MEQHLQILNRNSVYAHQSVGGLWRYSFRWSIMVKRQFSSLPKADRSGQEESLYSYVSKDFALAAGAEMQDSMEAEWQNKYAELGKCTISIEFQNHLVLSILSSNRI